MYRQGESEKFTGKAVLTWIYRFLMVAIMLAGTLILTNFPLNIVEHMFMMVVYLLMLTGLQGVYGAFNIGRSRVPELVLSQTLSNLISLSVLYAGTALYLHHLFSPLPWLVVLAAQEVWGIAWSMLANRRYYHRYVAPSTAILYQDESTLRLLYDTPHFEKKYSVRRHIQCTGIDFAELQLQLSDCEVVFVTDVPDALVNQLAKYCVDNGKKGFFLPQIGQIILSGAAYVSAFSMPMLAAQRADLHGAYRVSKRLFDIAASLAGIVVTLPIMLVTALAIRLEDHGPVLYRQTRLTRGGREFSILKFRSMRVNAEQDGVARLALQNDSRITRVGRFIRACRIDELPQLFNILMGDMTIVGPRPERPELARQYTQELPEFALRLQVKAGLTGLAQVYGRYNTDPCSKLRMDLMYINSMSVLQDLYLILATVKTVFMKDSAAGVGEKLRTSLVEILPTVDSRSA